MRKAVIPIIFALVGAVLGAGAVRKKSSESLEKAKRMSDKYLALYLMADRWVRVKQMGKNLASYFEKNGYRKIAIYGMGYAGETLIDELENTGITVAYGIDKNADSIYTVVNVFSADDVLEDVDAVVVTAIVCHDEIKRQLSGKVECPVVTLEEVLFGV